MKSRGITQNHSLLKELSVKGGLYEVTQKVINNNGYLYVNVN